MNTVKTYVIASAIGLSVIGTGAAVVYNVYTPATVNVAVDVDEMKIATVMADKLIDAEDARNAAIMDEQHARHCRLWDTGVTKMPGC